MDIFNEIEIKIENYRFRRKVSIKECLESKN